MKQNVVIRAYRRMEMEAWKAQMTPQSGAETSTEYNECQST